MKTLSPALAAACLVLGACSLDDVDLTGKECPCAQGWVCDHAANECVREIDAGPDGGPDAGPMDAGTDAGMDAGMDAGPPDAGPPCNILMVIDPAADPSADPDVLAHLESDFDCAVTTVSDSEATTADAVGRDVIIISSTTRSSVIGGLYRSASQPLINWEPYVYPDMGMTDTSPGNDFGSIDDTSQLAIVDDTHPLAAGRSGTIEWIDAPIRMSWGVPGGEGTVVAEITNRPDGGVPQPGIFAYRAGDHTVAERAAGCRIGLPLSDTAASHLTDDGWAVFDAAVQWALDGCP